MNHLVLSGTNTIVPSGTGSSCYRGPESIETRYLRTACGNRNFSNLESFGFLLTDRALFPSVDSYRSAARNASLLLCSLISQTAKQQSHHVAPVSEVCKAGQPLIASTPYWSTAIWPFSAALASPRNDASRRLNPLNPEGGMHE